jgi:hypothetical protein
MKMTVFWGVALCCLIEIDQCFAASMMAAVSTSEMMVFLRDYMVSHPSSQLQDALGRDLNLGSLEYDAGVLTATP